MKPNDVPAAQRINGPRRVSRFGDDEGGGGGEGRGGEGRGGGGGGGKEREEGRLICRSEIKVGGGASGPE